MSTALAGSKLLILVGAGAAGSVIFNNPYIGDIVKDVARVIARHLKAGSGEGTSEDGSQSTDTAALTAQVRRLSQELRQLATLQSRPVVISHGSEQSRGSVLSLVVPVAVVGAVGYSYMWWKGIRFSDLMYVTRSGVNKLSESFQKRMEGFHCALNATKKQVTGRIDGVAKSLGEHMQVQLQINQKVGNVEKAVKSMDGSVKLLESGVLGMENKLEGIIQQQVFMSQGVFLLCKVVSKSLEGRAGTAARQDLEQLTRLTSATASSGMFAGTLGGLKDISSFVGELEAPPQPPFTEGQRTGRHMIGLGTLSEGGGSEASGACFVQRSASGAVRPISTVAAVGRLESLDVDARPREPAVQLRELTSEDEPRGSFNQSQAMFERRRVPGETLELRAEAREHQGGSGRFQDSHSVSSFTDEDLTFPPRRAPAGPALPHSRSQRIMPPVNFNL